MQDTSKQIVTPDTPVTTIEVQPQISPARIYTDIASNAFGVVLGLALGGFILWKFVEWLDIKGIATNLVNNNATQVAVIQSNSELLRKHSELIERQEKTASETTKAIHRIEDMISEMRDDLEKSGEMSAHYPPNKRSRNN